MFEQTISGNTKQLLAILGRNNFIQTAYLAGGTALALQFGHRLSVDLDFFTKEKFDEQKSLQILKNIHDFQFHEEQLENQTIIGNFEGIRFSIFYYEYKIIKPFILYQGVNMVSPEDVAAMKIAAVSGRGVMRDFVDLFFLAKHGFSLQQMLEFYDMKYGNMKELYLHIMKSLLYFEDAENDERAMPKMLIPCEWKEVKDLFIREVPKLDYQFR